ncbi:MAG: 2-hydroxychromene-2-carboxylate isomerase [Polyangiaceae bacterium]|nr:2-hydroxychromene-2-carboxylate isomerase [Polyangiaceae bacterium]
MPTTPRCRVRFLFDFISPYAYLGWTEVHAVLEAAGCEIEPVPVLFAALLDAYGQLGPAEIPPKRVYIFKDCVRRAHRLGVPFAPPPSHPFNPLLALRVASLPLEPPARRALVDELFRAAWGGGGGVETPAAVALAVTRAGLDAEAAVRAAGEPEGKARLRRQTDAAIAAGAFGVPTLLVPRADGTDELFWGADSLADVARFVRGEDPLDEAAFARWAHIAPSAVRPGSRGKGAGEGGR